MVGFSETERELLRFIQDRDGSVSKDELVSEGPASEEDVDELLLGLEDYLRWDLAERSGKPVRMFEVVDSVPECYACGRLLSFEEAQEFEGDVYCPRHYMDRVREMREEQKLEHRKRQAQMEERRSEMREGMDELRSELEDFKIDFDEVGSEGSEGEHTEVEKIIGVEPGEENVETVRQKIVTEDGDRFTLVVKKRLQCPDCGRVVVDEPVFPGACPECGETLRKE